MMKEVHGGNIYKYDYKVFDFSANLNPLGMPEEVKQAVISHIDEYESYPDPFNRELTAAVSRFHRVEPERICFGNGAADIIFRIALAEKPKKTLLVSPTFSEYQQAAETAGSEVVHHLLKEENDFFLTDRVLDDITEDIEMMFICNPNNPTGIPVPKALMLEIAEKCRACGVTLVIDECFAEFLDEEEKYSVMTDIDKLENVIILKAFTKIYAMAGLRLGYCICGNPEQAERIKSCLQPWAVSTAASKAGAAAMGLDGFVEKTKKYIRENRELLISGLKRLGYTVFPSEANYIFFRSEKNLTGPLEKANIMVRSCANYITMDEHYYRIAVRTKEENEYFLRCLAEIENAENSREDK